MNLRFWRRETKASAASRVILLGLTMPGPIEHIKFDKLVKQTYERNITIYRCVRFLARSAAGVPWVLYQRGRTPASKTRRMMSETTWMKSFARAQDPLRLNRRRLAKAVELTEVENHDLLRLIEMPNPKQGQADYIEQRVSYLLLSGNAYEEFVSPNRKNARPLEMWNLRPDRVKVIPNSAKNRVSYPDLAQQLAETTDSLVLGYEYEASLSRQLFPALSTLHTRLFSPMDDWYGLSPLQVAMRAFQTDNKAADWQQALLENEARPSGVLINPVNSTDQDYERMNKMIIDSWTGSDRAGLPLYLEGGLKWEQLGLSPAELDFLQSRKFTRVELCQIFGVAPELVGDPDHKTFNSFPEARRSTYQDSVLPLLDAMRDAYNVMLTPLFGDRLYLDYDRDQIDALQEDRNAVWARMRMADHISIQEKREATGYDPQDAVDEDQEQMLEVPTALLPALLGSTMGLPLAALPADAALPTDPAVGDATLPSTSLNGAQVASLLDIVTRVATGELPRDTGVTLIAVAFNLSSEAAEKIMASVGRSFTLDKPVDAPPPATNVSKLLLDIQRELKAANADASLVRRLSPRQRRAMLKLRRGFERLLATQGAAIAKHVGGE